MKNDVCLRQMMSPVHLANEVASANEVCILHIVDKKIFAHVISTKTTKLLRGEISIKINPELALKPVKTSLCEHGAQNFTSTNVETSLAKRTSPN